MRFWLVAALVIVVTFIGISQVHLAPTFDSEDVTQEPSTGMHFNCVWTYSCEVTVQNDPFVCAKWREPSVFCPTTTTPNPAQSDDTDFETSSESSLSQGQENQNFERPSFSSVITAPCLEGFKFDHSGNCRMAF